MEFLTEPSSTVLNTEPIPPKESPFDFGDFVALAENLRSHVEIVNVKLLQQPQKIEEQVGTFQFEPFSETVTHLLFKDETNTSGSHYIGFMYLLFLGTRIGARIRTEKTVEILNLDKKADSEFGFTRTDRNIPDNGHTTPPTGKVD